MVLSRWKNKQIEAGMDSAKLIRNSGSYALLILSAGAMVFFGMCDPSGQRSGGGISGHAASVGSEDISRREFSQAYEQYRREMQQRYGENFDASKVAIARPVLDQLVKQRLDYLAAVGQGVQAVDDELYEFIKEIDAFKDKDGKFKVDLMETYLKNSGTSEREFLEDLRRGVTLQKYRGIILDAVAVSDHSAELEYKLNETKIDVEYLKIGQEAVQVTVTDEQLTKFLDDAGKAKVKSYYDANTREFNIEEEVHARHILVGFKGARGGSAEASKRSKEMAMDRAKIVLEKVKTPGANFAVIAKEFTDEAAGKESGGDLGFFSRGKMVKEFSDVAFKLAPGQISEVVESPFGYHVIKLEAKKDAKSTSLADATNDIARKLLRQDALPKALNQLSDDLLKNLTAGKSIDADLTTHKLAWKTTGQVALNARMIPGLGSDPAIQDAALSLKKPGEVFGKVLDDDGSKLIIRLKDKQIADVSKLDQERREALSNQLAMMTGYRFYTSMTKTLQEKLKNNTKVWENQSYLALDNREPAKANEEN